MLETYGLVLLQLFLIFLLSQAFTKNLFLFWFLLTTSKPWALRLSAVVLLPGTIIHELSHWFVAELLGVKTGAIDYMPRFESEGMRMGSIQIAKTDPFRFTLIGLAPLVVGISFMVIAVHFLPAPVWNHFSWWPTIPLISFTVLVSNTMFSSKADLGTAFVPAALLVFLSIGLYFWGVSFPVNLVDAVNQLVIKLNPVFSVVIGINLLFLLCVKALAFICGKLLHRRVITHVN